jgi:hypothetical protein
MTNLKEVVQELLQNADSNTIQEFFGSEMQNETTRWDCAGLIEFKTEVQLKGISMENVDQHGGEGEGEQYWSVYKFTKEEQDVFVKFNGWYQSYNGAEFTEWFFVEPKNRMVTFYEA